MSEERSRAHQQTLEAIQEIAEQTEKIQGEAGAAPITFPAIRGAFEQVHRAIYALHKRLDALEES